MSRLFFVPLLFASFFAFAQTSEDKIRLSGDVVDADTKEAVPFVHIINKTTNQGSTTNGEGKFVFTVEKTDTLVFSSMGYEKSYLILSELEPQIDGRIKIALKPSTTELKSVEVFAFKDMESFKKDFLALELPKTQEKISIPGSYEGPRRELKPTILSPISYVYSMFDSKAKEKIKLAEVQQGSDQWKQLIKKYDFIREITSLEDDDLEEFLEFCHLDHKKIEASTDYDLAVAIHKCLPDFKAKKESNN